MIVHPDCLIHAYVPHYQDFPVKIWTIFREVLKGSLSREVNLDQAMNEKNVGVLFFIQLCMNFYKSGTGFARIELIFPAGVAGPASAENTLAETRYGVVG
jgi:hypothetical protein